MRLRSVGEFRRYTRFLLRRALPVWLKATARPLQRLLLFSDVGSARRYATCQTYAQPHGNENDNLVEVRLRQLGGSAVTLRRVGSDTSVLQWIHS